MLYGVTFFLTFVYFFVASKNFWIVFSSVHWSYTSLSQTDLPNGASASPAMCTYLWKCFKYVFPWAGSRWLEWNIFLQNWLAGILSFPLCLTFFCWPNVNFIPWILLAVLFIFKRACSSRLWILISITILCVSLLLVFFRLIQKTVYALL